MGLPPYVAGYAIPFVAGLGGHLRLHVSADRPQQVRTRVVRMACVSPEPAGPPERLEPTSVLCPPVIAVTPQPLDPGSRLEAVLPCVEWTDVLTIGLGVRPTRGDHDQVLLALGTAASDTLRLERASDGGLSVALCDAALPMGIHLATRQWTQLSLTIDLTAGRLSAAAQIVTPGLPGVGTGNGLVQREIPFEPCAAMNWDHLRLAAGAPGARACFDGRLDLPIVVRGVRDLLPLLSDPDAETKLAADPDVVLAFGFRATGANCQRDVTGQVTAQIVHHPLAAVKGMRWTGETHDRRLKPAHYSALQFNSDAMTDAGWSPTLALTLPSDLSSGAYALEMTAEEGTRVFAPFFVSAAGAPRHRLAFLVPTFSYLAYCNAPEAMRGPPSARGLLPAECLLDALGGAFGRSLYERFADGSGVIVTGERKPLLSIGPDHRLWGFAADSMLTDWMEKRGFAHDLVTDHDLHRNGPAALSGLDVLVTGSHPEYWTTRMWDSLSAWIAGGGRLLYLGGNGFYWRTAIAEDGALEVRRAEDGTRPFIGEPAEYVHAFSDEQGGLWRRLGRPPQALVGVGMAAQGFSRSTHYRKTAQADDPAVAFVFDGVGGRTFGHGGLQGGGAAGYEVDRHDASLGSDPDAWVLASSQDLPADVLRTKEEMLSFVPPSRDSKARADMVLTVREDGRGAVFAVGSIAWIGSLADPDCDGAAAAITGNVIRRFLDPAVLPRRPAAGKG